MRTRQRIAQFAIICSRLSIDAAAIWANGLVNDQKSLPVFELSRLLARLNHVDRFIVNANHSAM
jgi:hypothetical protein